MVLSHEYKIFILGQKSDHFLTIILCICAWTNSHFWTASSGTTVSVYSDFLGGFSLPYTFDKQIIIQADHKRPWRSPANNDLT